MSVKLTTPTSRPDSLAPSKAAEGIECEIGDGTGAATPGAGYVKGGLGAGI